MLAVLVQLINERPPRVEWEALRIICEAFIAIHVINVIPHGVQWNLSLLVVRHHLLRDGHIPITPSALMKSCNMLPPALTITIRKPCNIRIWNQITTCLMHCVPFSKTKSSTPRSDYSWITTYLCLNLA